MVAYTFNALLKMKPDLVVFDLAGTTVEDNQDVPRILMEAMKKFNVTIALEHAIGVMGIPKPVAIRQLLQANTGQRISNSLIREIHRVFIKDMISFYRYDPSVREKEGVSLTFMALKHHNIKIAVDTGFDRLVTNSLLERLGWIRDGLIDCSVTSDEVLRGRPFPDMIFKVMQLTGTNDPSKVAKVGDTVSDLLEGNAAGCRWVIGVTSGAFPEHILKAEQHTHLVGSVPEVLPMLNLPLTITSP